MRNNINVPIDPEIGSARDDMRVGLYSKSYPFHLDGLGPVVIIVSRQDRLGEMDLVILEKNVELLTK